MSRLLLSAAALLLLGCGHAAFTLTVPRDLAPNEVVRVHVTIGSLPRGARVVAKLPNGEIVGTISPHGSLSASRGPYTIAIPAHGVRNGKVTLHVQIIDERGAAPRAPSEREIEKIELSLVKLGSHLENQLNAPPAAR